ncbi:thiamine pyrophosphate-binding protein [Candidatus Pacearchaeota archaeon]|nr:thiamine pyrophosphate-binding protein [Candidatus Pacearchaeota archaeon]
MKLSDYVLDYLKKIGIKHAFLITGGAIMNIVNSFDEDKNLKFICTTQEQGAAIAAEAYSRITKNFGCAMATSGPGATNLITGIGCAYFDSIPTIYITGQVNTHESTWEKGPRQVGFQETDIVSIAKPITKFAVKVDDPEDIKYYLDKAIYTANEGRPGPVLIDIPMNVQRAQIDPEKLRSYEPEEKKVDYGVLGGKVDEMIKLINESNRPVIIIGAGVKLANCESETREIIEKLKIPVCPSWGAIDVLEHDHVLFMENFGVSANRAGNFAVQNSDLIISIGSRLDTRQVGGKPETFAREAKKVVVDIDSAELHKGRGMKIDIPINYNIKDFYKVLLKKINEFDFKIKEFSSWINKIRELKEKYPICPASYYEQVDKVNPYVFMDVLSKESKEGDIIITDAGGNLTWTMQGFKVKKDQKLFSAYGNSPMGYSMAAAMGASVAADNKPVICIIGDGGIKMNINELETIARHKIPVKIFVINNHEYGIIKQFQDVWLDSCYKATCVEGGLGDPDLIRIANSYDIPGVLINNHKELKEKIREVLDSDGPVLCNVEVKHGEKIVPKLEFGKPIEDPSPLLSREEFNNNMIVKPLDSKESTT